MKDLSIVIEGHAPTVRASHASTEKAIHPQGARVQAPNPGAIETGNTPGRFHAREGVQSLGEPETAIWSLSD